MTPTPALPLVVSAVRANLRAAAQPEKAAGMAAYMKSAMPYLGVTFPAVERCVREAVRDHPIANPAALLATAGQLWELADYREDRYAAIRLTHARAVSGDVLLLPFYRTVIAEGQWWDYVDAVAPQLGELLREHPTVMAPQLRSWATHPNLWFRRSAITAQLRAKETTDRQLLSDVLVVNLADPEFFIRKAIGWALRQYARTDPDWVRAFTHTHAGELSALSRREALKHLGP